MNVYGIGQKNSANSVNEYNANMKLTKDEVGNAVVGQNIPPDALLRPVLYSHNVATGESLQIQRDIFEGTKKSAPQNTKKTESSVKISSILAGALALGGIGYLVKKFCFKK